MQVRKLEIKQAEQKHEFLREWERMIQKVENQLNDSISKKTEINSE